jgi:alpha-mannosidase
MKSSPLLLLLAGFATASLHAETFQAQPAKPVDLGRDKNLYLVGYAHLDTQWRWTYQETIRDYIRNTMEQNFPLLDKYPNYIFNFTGSRRYEFMKEYYPEDYERVKKYIAAGRWAPVGASVDECDANAPSLESLERHFLYGNHFFQREFGKQSDDFMLPDCFGFPASLPTILAHGGIKGFSTQKLTWGSAVGIPFNVGEWIGPDGSSILAALNPLAYAGLVTNDLSKDTMWLKRINDNGQKSGVYADYHYYGTGDRGGAASESSVQWIERSLAGGGPIRVISSRSDQIFNDITPAMAARLPTYKGELELVNHSAGSITSEAYMKRWNRKNEQLAAAAESAATAAAWLGVFPYPSDPIYNAWDLVLGSQMHDIMPGTSVPKAYEFSWNDEVLALNQFASITERSTAAVLATLDTRVQGVPVAVYNPLAIEREDLVEAVIPFAGRAPGSITAYDPLGRPVPAQILDREGANIRVLFPARVPSAGYAIYDLRPDVPNATRSPLIAGANSLENARYCVTLNAGGDIASIFDKSLGRELLSAPARLSIHTENPAQYPAWNMDWEDRQKPARAFVGGPAKIRIVEDGPVRVALEVERTTENSIFTQQIRLAAGSAGDRVEILYKIDWRAFEASLKADFPFAAANPEASFDDKVGVVRRGTDNPKAFELSQQQWMDLTSTDGSYGVSVLNDSKYGSDKPDDHTLRSTLIYTPGTRGGTPDQGSQDQGRHEILLALVGHRGDWTEGRAPWQAAGLNQPLRAFLPEAHPGQMGKSFSLLSLNRDQAQVVAVKKAEDSDEVIVRMKELAGKPATGLVLRFAAPILAAQEVDGQERPIGGATVKDGTLAFDMKGSGLRAFALTLSRPSTRVAPVTSHTVSLAYDTDVVSSRAKRDDGAMDASGGAYPAELFPKRLEREGVTFHFGPVADGAKNALSARGQRIDLPAGDFNRIHLLAAAAGDATARVRIGDTEQPFDVPNWTGYIGQWDNRIWGPPFRPGASKDDPIGLTPGFIKRIPVAWFATHHNTPQGDAYYEYSYLFQLSYDLPPGAKSITLPDAASIRVFAMSVSREPSAAPPAAPLYDTLSDHQPGGAPIIPQAGQILTDSTNITLLPPLYYRPRDLHYTLDGSIPTESSPTYDGPFFAVDTAAIAVRQIDANGHAGLITRGVVTIHDQTPPRLISILAARNGNTIDLAFSKPLAPAGVADMRSYVVQPAIQLVKATQSPDGRQVTLSLGAPLTEGTSYTLTVQRLRDTSPRGNLIEQVTKPFTAGNIVYSLPSAELPSGALKTPVSGLPVQRTDNWTMNLFVRPVVKPADRTIIAGFGQDDDQRGGGGARYFAVFSDGIRFWSSNRDVTTNSPLELGRWQMLTATYDGKTVAVYKDGQPIMKKDVQFAADSEASVNVGGADPWDHKRLFEGSVRDFTIRLGALNGDEVKKLFETAKPPQ